MIQNMIQQQHSISMYKHDGQQQLTCAVELNVQEYYLMQLAQGVCQQLQ